MNTVSGSPTLLVSSADVSDFERSYLTPRSSDLSRDSDAFQPSAYFHPDPSTRTRRNALPPASSIYNVNGVVGVAGAWVFSARPARLATCTSDAASAAATPVGAAIANVTPVSAAKSARRRFQGFMIGPPSGEGGVGLASNTAYTP